MNTAFNYSEIDEWEDIFERFPFLIEYKGLFTPDIQVLGLWWNGIILESQENGLVYKIPLNKKDDKTKHEFLMHDRFRSTLEWNMRKKWNIPDYIQVPKLHNSPFEHNWLYAMEHIQGRSFNSLVLIDKYSDILSPEEQQLNDFGIEDALVNKYWLPKEEILPNSRDLYDESISSIIDWEKMMWLTVTLQWLEDAWLHHDDLHLWNFMLWDNGNIYIIDFGDSKREKQLLSI